MMSGLDSPAASRVQLAIHIFQDDHSGINQDAKVHGAERN